MGQNLLEHKVIHNIPKNSNITINFQQKIDIIPIKRGVRQSGVISPKLFTLALKEIFRPFDWTQYGININGMSDS